MVYVTPFPYLFIYWSISISCRDGFVIGGWKSIIIELIAISHEIIYTLLGGSLNRSLTGIGYYRNLPPLLLLLFIFEHIFFTTFFDDSNPPMPLTQLCIYQRPSLLMSTLSLQSPRPLKPWPTSLDWFVQQRKARSQRPWGLREYLKEPLPCPKKVRQETKGNPLNACFSCEKW